jgi:hypothetical protein
LVRSHRPTIEAVSAVEEPAVVPVVGPLPVDAEDESSEPHPAVRAVEQISNRHKKVLMRVAIILTSRLHAFKSGAGTLADGRRRATVEPPGVEMRGSISMRASGR